MEAHRESRPYPPRHRSAARLLPLLLLGLVGCGGARRAAVEAPAAPTIHPGSPYTKTTPQGLTVRARSLYDGPGDWQRFGQRLGEAHPGIERALGAPAVSIVSYMFTGVHARVAAEVARRVRFGPLRRGDWRGVVVDIRVDSLETAVLTGAAAGRADSVRVTERDGVRRVTVLGPAGRNADSVRVTLRSRAVITVDGQAVAHRDIRKTRGSSAAAPVDTGDLVVETAAEVVALLAALPRAQALPASADTAVDARVAAIVVRLRQQYERLRTGDGWARREVRTGAGGPLRPWTRTDYRIAFDETRAQVHYRRVMELPDGPRTDMGGEYFADDWRGGWAVEDRRGQVKRLRSILPVHAGGLPQSPVGPLALVEGALRRGQLEVVGAQDCGDRACTVLEGTAEDGEKRERHDLRLWLAPDMGYLPVRIEVEVPVFPAVMETLFEYTEAQPGVWMPARVASGTRFPGDVSLMGWEQELVYEPGFVVNAGTPELLNDTMSLLVDEEMWEGR